MDRRAGRRRLALLLFAAGLAAGTVMAVEEPAYGLLEQSGDFELRRYGPQIVAETWVEGTFSEVGNEGFRRLAGYIFGKNRKKAAIEMTAPVNQAAVAEKIAMTAPVNQSAVDGTWRITFIMPASHTMATLPEPLDPRVVLREEPGRLMAALRYSGTWSRERYRQKEKALRSWLPEHGLEPVGTPIFARYNPPFMPWFLRRNEVLIEVERRD